MEKSFQTNVQEQIKREVETAVQRVMRDVSFNAALAGRFDSSESWKTGTE
jgi:hypothetical protein